MTVACIGHRHIPQTQELADKVQAAVYALVVEEHANTFLFGSKSEFNDLCWRAVTSVRQEFPDIRRIYVRSAYPYVSEAYLEYLLSLYDETYFPPQIEGAGYRSYVKRNQEMIGKCDVLFCYYSDEHVEKMCRPSGTGVAVRYARKNGKRIWNIWESRANQ